jgi:hypothetical protein
MIDVPLSKILEGAYKVGRHFREKEEGDQMQAIADNLRRRSYADAGNCLRPEIGSKEDRLCSKMVAKGYLVRVPFGYMLPEFVRNNGGSLY